MPTHHSTSICPKCSRDMRRARVKAAIWVGEGLFVVEDLPAMVCDECTEQFYDPEVTGMLRKWAQEGFRQVDAQKEILVPIYSLADYTDLGEMDSEAPST